MATPQPPNTTTATTGTRGAPAWASLAVVLAGLGVLLAAFLVCVFHYPTAADVATALAAMAGTVGTVVGAFFGVQAGSHSGQQSAAMAEQARHEAEAGRKVAEDRAVRMAAAADPEMAAIWLRAEMPPATQTEPGPGAAGPA